MCLRLFSRKMSCLPAAATRAERLDEAPKVGPIGGDGVLGGPLLVAQESVSSGRAYEKLEALIEMSNMSVCP